MLIYLVDTLRADRLGVYGYDKPTSPNLDALAGDGIVFSHGLAQSSWTRPSVASLLTGLHPRSHGVNSRADALSETATTLAVALGAAGYQTAAFVTNGNVSPTYGFDLGFDDFSYLGERPNREVHVQSDGARSSARPPSFSGAKSTSSATSSTTCRSGSARRCRRSSAAPIRPPT